MNKFTAYAIPTILLVFFVAVMISPQYAKKPLRESDDVSRFVTLLRQDIQSEDWTQAEATLGSLKKAWAQVIPRIQYGSEKDDIDDVSTGIARLQGAIAGQDKRSALVYISEIENSWHSIGS